MLYKKIILKSMSQTNPENQTNPESSVFGFVINEMQENFENALFSFREEREKIKNKIELANEKNAEMNRKVEEFKIKQNKTDNEIEKLENDITKIKKDFNEIKNFIQQRPFQPEDNQWSYQNLSVIAADLLQKIQNEKKKQQQILDDISTMNNSIFEKETIEEEEEEREIIENEELEQKMNDDIQNNEPVSNDMESQDYLQNKNIYNHKYITTEGKKKLTKKQIVNKVLLILTVFAFLLIALSIVQNIQYD